MSESPGPIATEEDTINTNFVIELEDDPRKNEELKISFRFLNQSDVPPPLLDNDAPALDHYESAPNFGKSYLSFQFTTIQPLGDSRTLFVVRLHFHPATNTQFTNAIVKWEFLPSDVNTSNPLPAPRVVLHAPRKSYGGLTKEKKRTVWGLQLPLTIGVSPVTTGVSLSSELEREKEVEQSMTITGTARGAPFRKGIIWTVEENSSSSSGLPSEIQLSAVVEHHGPILCKVSVKGTVNHWFMPSRHLQSKAGPLGKGIIIDVNAYKGCLREYEFKGDTREGLKRLLAGWTGQVDDALLPFGAF